LRADLDLPGGPSIYPGHGITVAYLITQSHPCFEEASAPTRHGWPRALSNSDVPGSGDGLYRGLDVLRRLHEGADLPVVVARAREAWESVTANGFQDKRLAGQEQADKVLPLLAGNPTWWQPRPNGALLDETRTYRYLLWRDCGEGVGTVAFVMLNPSTADESENDNTIRKCMTFARKWGYKRLVVVNLFGFRTKDPDELEKIRDREKAVGLDNDAFLDAVCGGYGPWAADLVIAAWGGHGKHLDRDHVVLERLRKAKHPPHYLKLSTGKRKSPYHPLYLPGNLKPQLL
jgi:hypothetical protein